MSVYMISDTHFGNKKYLEFEKTPFTSLEDKETTMIYNWNETVDEEDDVFILGDLLDDPSPRVAAMIKRLHGHKILIRGNHDIYPTSFYIEECDIEQVCSFPIVYKDFFILSHKPPEFYNMAMPYAYIYGHVHNTEMYQTQTRRSACVCVERWNYIPVNFKKLKEAFS